VSERFINGSSGLFWCIDPAPLFTITQEIASFTSIPSRVAYFLPIFRITMNSGLKPDMYCRVITTRKMIPHDLRSVIQFLVKQFLIITSQIIF
jgi:hypothetical protein